MIDLPERIKADLALEPRIAAMAPSEPDILCLLAALRFLETSWGEDLAIVADIDQNGRGYLRRKFSPFQSGKMRQSWNVGINDGKYVNYVQVQADRYEEVYPDFIAAAFRFAGRPRPSIAAAAFIKRMAEKATGPS